jgi:hypothetical protein
VTAIQVEKTDLGLVRSRKMPERITICSLCADFAWSIPAVHACRMRELAFQFIILA